MRTRRLSTVPVLALFAAATLAFACQDGDAGSGGFTLSSPSFMGGAAIPPAHCCGAGDNNWRRPSVPLRWNGAPAGAKSFVLLMDDPHPVARYWVHWFITELPTSVSELAVGASGKLPAPARERVNSFGELGYGGPCPPPGSGEHPYRFQLFAMPDEKIELPKDAETLSGDRLSAILKGKALGVATVTGTFKR